MSELGSDRSSGAARPPRRPEFQVRSERIEELVRVLESADDPKLYAVSVELMQAVMELHGAGLESILAMVAESTAGPGLVGQFAEDDLVASLLLLHGLHPDDMETRVLHALERLRPHLLGQSADAELLGIEEGAIRLRVHTTAGGGCHSSVAAIRADVEAAVSQAAPDAVRISSEEVERPRPVQLVTLK